MNKQKRIEVVKALDTIARCVNDEGVFMYWLSMGIADGDIENGYAEDYIDDDSLSDVLGAFMHLMKRARTGGLYVDGVTDNSVNY